MGLFDKIAGGSKKPMTVEEAFAGIMLATAAADGQISDEEVSVFNSAANRLKIFAPMPGAEFSSMIDRLFRSLNNEGPASLLQQCAEILPDDLRAPAFCNAVDLVFADGEVLEDEKEVIEGLAQLLGIESGDAEMIVNVLAIKNLS